MWSISMTWLLHEVPRKPMCHRTVYAARTEDFSCWRCTRRASGIWHICNDRILLVPCWQFCWDKWISSHVTQIILWTTMVKPKPGRQMLQIYPLWVLKTLARQLRPAATKQARARQVTAAYLISYILTSILRLAQHQTSAPVLSIRNQTSTCKTSNSSLLDVISRLLDVRLLLLQALQLGNGYLPHLGHLGCLALYTTIQCILVSSMLAVDSLNVMTACWSP